MYGPNKLDYDVEETDDEVRLHFDTSGAEPEDVHLEVDEGAVHVSAVTYEDIEYGSGSWHRAQEFYARVPLPYNADTRHLHSNFSHGQFDVIIPKMA